MLINHLNHALLEREGQALRRHRRSTRSPCSPQLELETDGGNARALLAFCSNDYLGLASHPALVEALAQGARRWGVGSGASHLVSGHSRAHDVLEEQLARWLSPAIPNARVLTFSTGYMANLALLTALADGNTTIFSDQLNHASLIDGARLAKAKVQIYPHCDLASLHQQLLVCESRLKLIVTDAVFSMDGTIADLSALLELAQQHDAWLVVDDAHGFGVLGPKGQGSLAHFDLHSERIVYMGTLGKAAGVGGAFVAAHPTIVEWLLQVGRPYIFTTAMPPAQAHALSASLDLISGEEGHQRRCHLQGLITQLRTGLQALIDRHPDLGWQLAPSQTAIQPLVIGSNAHALRIAASLEQKGLWVPAIRPPTVPEGTARLRVTLSAAHDPGHIETLLTALEDSANEVGT